MADDDSVSPFLQSVPPRQVTIQRRFVGAGCRTSGGSRAPSEATHCPPPLSTAPSTVARRLSTSKCSMAPLSPLALLLRGLGRTAARMSLHGGGALRIDSECTACWLANLSSIDERASGGPEERIRQLPSSPFVLEVLVVGFVVVLPRTVLPSPFLAPPLTSLNRPSKAESTVMALAVETCILALENGKKDMQKLLVALEDNYPLFSVCYKGKGQVRHCYCVCTTNKYIYVNE